MNGRPYRAHGRIAPMPELELVDRASRRLPLWLALIAFVLFAAIVGGWHAFHLLVRP